MKRSRSFFLETASVVAAVLFSARPALAAEGGLEIFPDWTQLLPLILAFVVLMFPVNALLLRPLLAVLDARAERVEGARQRAARLAEEAEQSLGRYRGEIGSARAAAEQQRRALVDETRREQTRLTAEARGEAEETIERARGEVGVALAEARAGLARQAEVLAREAVERVLGRRLA